MSSVSVRLLDLSGTDTGIAFNEVGGSLVSNDTSGLPVGTCFLKITVGSQTNTVTIVKGE
jgi:hypothetical protein